MPFYEYECANCKVTTEVMQKINDAPLLKCPSCGKNKLKKLISAPVFRLKGGGWYETDFKSDKEAKRNLAGGDESDSKSRDTTPPAETKAADAKSDAKPDSKSDTKSESKPAEKTPSSASHKSSGRSSSAKPVKAAAKPLSRAPIRKPAPKAKAKAGKRRGR